MIFGGDFNKLGVYVRDMANRMGLRDWLIEMSHDRPDDDQCAADVNVIYGRKVAVIRMAPAWASEKPESLRATIAHELIHCHLNPMRGVLDNVQHALGQPVYMTAYNALTDYIEYATDAIATEWAESLPLPVEANPKRKKAAA